MYRDSRPPIFVYVKGVSFNCLIMKLRVLLFAIVVFGMGACTQRTCPTYTKNDIQKQEITKHQDARV